MKSDFGNDLEVEIWLLGVAVYGSHLESILGLAIQQYRRRLGLEDLTRIYLSSIGAQAFQALKGALKANGHTVGGEYVGLHSGMRWHLRRSLQQALIRDQHATQAMRDDSFAAELGL